MMELYTAVSYKSSELLTRAYSTSFSLSSLFFAKSIRKHIYAIYGLVRIADEVVDTYKAADARQLLDMFERNTYAALARGYDTNPIIQAFIETARNYAIGHELIAPFFKSMRIDLDPKTYNKTLYQEYIHGSAEVVGLMCLRVFCQGDRKLYERLQPGAAALGSAYQKVNFLRDLADDHNRLGRVYFPGVTFETFREKDKKTIINDIEKDFRVAHLALMQLPRSSRIATLTSYAYYQALLRKLKATPASELKRKRVRVNDVYKIYLLIRVALTNGWKR